MAVAAQTYLSSCRRALLEQWVALLGDDAIRMCARHLASVLCHALARALVVC